MISRLSYHTIGRVLSFVDTHRVLGMCMQSCRGWRDASIALVSRRYARESTRVDAVISLVVKVIEHVKRLGMRPLRSWVIGHVDPNRNGTDDEFDEARLQSQATVARFTRVKSLEWLARYGLSQYVAFCDAQPCHERLLLVATERDPQITASGTFETFTYRQFAWQHADVPSKLPGWIVSDHSAHFLPFTVGSMLYGCIPKEQPLKGCAGREYHSHHATTGPGDGRLGPA
jgi:hypothetical protein